MRRQDHDAHRTRLLFALALAAGAAQAQPRAPLGGNVVGGGDATISGGGDDLTITYNTGGAGDGGGLLSQPGRFARFAGSHGDGPQVEYSSAGARRGRPRGVAGGRRRQRRGGLRPAPLTGSSARSLRPVPGSSAGGTGCAGSALCRDRLAPRSGLGLAPAPSPD